MSLLIGHRTSCTDQKTEMVAVTDKVFPTGLSMPKVVKRVVAAVPTAPTAGGAVGI